MKISLSFLVIATIFITGCATKSPPAPAPKITNAFFLKKGKHQKTSAFEKMSAVERREWREKSDYAEEKKRLDKYLTTLAAKNSAQTKKESDWHTKYLEVTSRTTKNQSDKPTSRELQLVEKRQHEQELKELNRELAALKAEKNTLSKPTKSIFQTAMETYSALERRKAGLQRDHKIQQRNQLEQQIAALQSQRHNLISSSFNTSGSRSTSSSSNNKGESALRCIKLSRDGGHMYWKNNCSYTVTVGWCTNNSDDSQYCYKSGDYAYFSSTSIGPSKKGTVATFGENGNFEWGVCKGSEREDGTRIKAVRSGKYRCSIR